ncbi:MinD/ParA family ATP-binding protein [Zhihengliuella flava]|uniref:MinD-like ATPase involved in chromosome partitioning or flagellar assembly n=1 Tax=Zhihengliuella flava TaxID=1285193 RepID=A0A931GG32_9MICC|nr:ATPase [Zhihengliuella flava]MBG6085337.1 MinD-like ATPase involved in chromosome partitioning or flagellar assembly [Zhihengliuella flava]
MTDSGNEFPSRAQLRRDRQRAMEEQRHELEQERKPAADQTSEDTTISVPPPHRPARAAQNEAPLPRFDAAERPAASAAAQRYDQFPPLSEVAPSLVPNEAAPATAEPDSDVPEFRGAEEPSTSPAASRQKEPVPSMTPAERDDRSTFLRNSDDAVVPAQEGFRGFLNRLGFKLEPTGAELQDRQWRAQVGRRVGRPTTVSIVNGKGGANKTPTTVLLASVFGRNSSQSVLAWDNNGTRGTLGWRTAADQHSSHVMNLLHDADDLLSVRPTEHNIDGYVHYQPADRFSVLRTEPTLLASEQSVSSDDFDALHAVVSRYFQITFVDSGNDESAERWLRMIDHTDQLVIASTTVEEHAEAGALLLEALTNRGGRYAELARNAVVIVSEPSPSPKPGQLRRITKGFEHLARSVVTIPHDPHLVKGQIRFDALKLETKRAWLRAAAAVSEGVAG